MWRHLARMLGNIQFSSRCVESGTLRHNAFLRGWLSVFFLFFRALFSGNISLFIFDPCRVCIRQPSSAYLAVVKLYFDPRREKKILRRGCYRGCGRKEYGEKSLYPLWSGGSGTYRIRLIWDPFRRLRCLELSGSSVSRVTLFCLKVHY